MGSKATSSYGNKTRKDIKRIRSGEGDDYRFHMCWGETYPDGR